MKLLRYKASWGLNQKDAEIVGKELTRISEINNGTLTREMVLAEAEHAESLLHRYFEWDDGKAAHEYRLEQARYLIRSIKVVVEEEERPIKFFQPVKIQSQTDDTVQERVFVPLTRVIAEADLRQQVIQNALTEVKGWQFRYQQYKELAPIFTAIGLVQEELTRQVS